MEISGFSKYDVYINSKGSYLDYEGEFRDYTDMSVVKSKDGGWVLDFIGKRLLEKECCGFHWSGDRVVIDFFNPLTGGCDTLWIRFIEEVRK